MVRPARAQISSCFRCTLYKLQKGNSWHILIQRLLIVWERYLTSFNEKRYVKIFVCNFSLASVGSLQIKYSLAETADNMQNLTQIQIALNLAISPEQNNGKAGAGGGKSEGHKEIQSQKLKKSSLEN